MKPNKIFLLICAALAGLFLALPNANAQTGAQTVDEPEHVRISLIPEMNELFPGGSLFVVIKQEIDEGWHTYWKNPGDSGEPMRINWDMPPGFEPMPIRWPVPERIDIGPLTNYGYENEVSLLQEIRIPYEIPEGPVTFTANIDILVCKDICIPESHTASLTLNDGQTIDNAALINELFADMPTPVNWDATYSENETGQFVIEVDFEQPGLIASGKGKVRLDILPYEWGIIDNTAGTAARFLEKRKVRLVKKRGDRPLDEIGPLTMLITYDLEAGKRGALEITAVPDSGWLAGLTAGQSEKTAEPAPKADEDTGKKKSPPLTD